jgi:hypothetical protein
MYTIVVGLDYILLEHSDIRYHRRGFGMVQHDDHLVSTSHSQN